VKPPGSLGQTAHIACQGLGTTHVHQVGKQVSDNTTLKIATVQSTAMLKGTAGFRTIRLGAEILVGDFAAKLERIIHPLERLGPEEHTVFSGKVDHALKVSIQVRNRFSRMSSFIPQLKYNDFLYSINPS
jgi:hypothetical protein